jgi:hypothetical protein
VANNSLLDRLYRKAADTPLDESDADLLSRRALAQNDHTMLNAVARTQPLSTMHALTLGAVSRSTGSRAARKERQHGFLTPVQPRVAVLASR